MKIKIIGYGPITSAQLETLSGTSTINRKSPLEEAMEKLVDEAIHGEKKTKSIIIDSLGGITEEVEKDAIGKYSSAPICFDIQSILANHKKNAFTVVWGDGSHTTIHLQPGDEWDDEKALAMCFVKHLCEDKGNFNDIFTEDMPAKIKHIGQVEPVEEKHECHCSSDTCGPCRDCDGGCHLEKETKDTKRVAEAMTNAGAAAEKTTNTLTELIHELSKKNNTNDKTPPAKKRYQVLLRTGLYDDQLIFESDDLQAVRKFISTNSKSRGYGYYLRLWSSADGLYIDYGSHTTYFFIPGMTVDEWTRK
jgi:hypothetical protein